MATRISIRISSDELEQALKAAAVAAGRSVAEEARIRLARSLRVSKDQALGHVGAKGHSEGCGCVSCKATEAASA